MKILKSIIDLIHNKENDTYESLLDIQNKSIQYWTEEYHKLSNSHLNTQIFLWASGLLNLTLLTLLIGVILVH